MRALGVALLTALLVATVPAPSTAEPVPVAEPAAGAGPGRASYDVRLTGDETGVHWRGRLAVRFINTTSQPMPLVWLRLWGNGLDGCAAPAVEVDRVRDGDAGPLAVDCTALPVRLRHPLRPGHQARVSFDVDITVPDRDARFGRHAGASFLGFALPVLAVRDGAGWHLEPYSNRGESNYTLTADWRVRLDHPATMAVPASGVAVSRPGRPGRTVTTVRSPRARDFAFAAGRFVEHTATTTDGVLVRLWQGADVPDAVAENALNVAVRSMETFTDWYGAYPYPEVDVVTGDFPWGSMEYPTFVVAVPGPLAISHELAHQWWYGLVGNNQYADPWLDEALTHYSALRLTGAPGVDCANPPWFGPDPRVTNGMDYYETNPGYVIVVYLIGACLLADLEQTIGSDRMLAMLRDYATDNRYRIATPDGFRAAAQAATSTDLGPLWERWRAN